ncbi:HSP90-domain-containing protein [Chytridium lagenaria]|nr:HSP90-domain-containing protein [Chytridium lagenaria]
MLRRLNLLSVLLLLLVALSGVIRASDAVVDSDDSDSLIPPEYKPLDGNLSGDKFKFESENSKILHIVINSLYKSKEIFLRELISNAADALDKIRFVSLTNADVLNANPRLDIRIVADKERKLLTITDSGVGMTSEELKRNLGTIAKSGTSEFLAALERNSSDLGLIGQFGVGFYSVFLVCDRVTVASKSINDDQYVWESTSENEYTIAKDPRGNSLGRGTEITLHIKNDATEFLDSSVLENLVLKYSEFINFPIYLWKSKTIEEEVTEETEKDMDSDVEDVKDEKPEKITRTIQDWALMNENKPIWTRSPSEVEESEYKEFYKAFAKDTSEPLSWIHFRAEGDIDFKSVLFIPSKAGPSFLQKAEGLLKNIKLFVKKVFITDEMEDFLPRWLSFIKGLVDSDDLPLNVSRETLQKHGLLKTIKKKLIGKTIEMITQLSKDAAKYKTFIEQFGIAIKLGVIEDTKNRKKLDKLSSLEDYVSRMKSKQPQIYYLTGSSLEEIKNSPHLEVPLAKGFEVIYMSDPLDEYLTQQVTEYGGFKLQSLVKNGVNKSEEEKFEKEYEDLTKWLLTSLDDVVDKVVISSRLTKSPTALLANEYGVSGNMERIMAAQALQSGDNFMRYEKPKAKPCLNYYAKMKKTLEINPRHPVIKGLKKSVASGKKEEDLKELARTLYEVTLLRSGFDLKDTPAFAGRVESAIRKALGVGLTEEAKVEVVKAEEKTEEEKKDVKEEESEETEDL